MRLRYGLGVLLGAIIPGIMFIGAAVINVLGFGVTDPLILGTLWNLYVLWFLVSAVIFVAPLIIVRFMKREMLRELLLFEVGGFAFFAPLWLFFAAEMTGYSIIKLFTVGVENALPSPGLGGTIVGVTINSIILIPMILVFMIFGAFILRPSFVYGIMKTTTKSALEGLKPAGKPETERPAEPATPPPTTPAPPRPASTEAAKQKLMNFLNEIGIPGPTIQKIIQAGFTSETELVATSSDQLAQMLGISASEAEGILVEVQKKVFFGGIS